jgi:hypothetical protein
MTIRFKITCENGRVFYVYAADEFQAIQTFATRKPPLTPGISEIEEDKDEWKTPMIENWHHGRPAA